MNLLLKKMARLVPRPARPLLMRNGRFIHGQPRSGYLILCYHSVRERGDYPFAVSPAEFEAQLAHLARWFNPVPLPALIAGIRAGSRFDPVQIAVTFDDGFMDNYDTALPLLLKYRIPATVFVSSVFPGAGSRVYMNWEQLAGMARYDLITIGSHGRTHTPLTALNKADVREELAVSRRDIEQHTGCRVDVFAYPFGIFNAGITALARETGYSAALSAGFKDKGLGEDDLYRLNRLVIDASNSEIGEFAYELARNVVNS